MDLADKLMAVFTPGEKVVAGLDGYLFSSLAAWAARQAGAHVEGVKLLLREGEDSCMAESAAEQIGINLKTVDCRGFFGEDVLSVYFAAIKAGQPIPACAICTGRARTAYLFRELMSCGASRFVTGDVARIERWNDGYAVYRAKNSGDTSSNLALVNPLTLPHMITPLGEAAHISDLLKLAEKIGFDMSKDKFVPCFWGFGVSRNSYQKDGEIIKEDEIIAAPLVGGLDKRNIRLRDTVFRKDEPPVSKVSMVIAGRRKKNAALLEIFFENKAALFAETPVFVVKGDLAAIYSGDRLIGGGIVD
jgi:tRNA U34 2-thiouridine synthase MnmA/TrmU